MSTVSPKELVGFPLADASHVKYTEEADNHGAGEKLASILYREHINRPNCVK